MSIRLAISATRHSDPFVERIRKLSGSDLDVVLHFGNRTSDFKASATSRMSLQYGQRGHLFSDQRWTGVAQSLFESPDYIDGLNQFIEELSRFDESYTYKNHKIQTMSDYSNYYHILTDVIANKLIEKKITHCLFFNVPHLSYDTVLYQTCKSLNIKTIIIAESFFPNHFWSMEDPKKMGYFPNTKNCYFYRIRKGDWPELNYMSGVKQEWEKSSTLSVSVVVKIFLYFLLKKPNAFLQPSYICENLKRVKNIYSLFPKWRDPFAEFFHEDSFWYFEKISKYEDNEINLSDEYVYFPLQLQPEMTTSALGGKFRDQALAIEKLAGILPDGVRILVKENPKQGSFARSPIFFYRLNRISSVTFLPSWADTRALTLNANFVATITGTVGWEAICQGKPALVFGNAWYRKLPGVTEWSDQLTYQEIVATYVDHDALQRQVGTLMAVTHSGVVGPQSEKIVPDFDRASNYDLVSRTLLDVIMGRAQTSFQ